MLNWSCPAAWLEPRVPIGTTLDTFQGNVLVSLVGFMFRDTRVLGVRVPWHHTFEEVNLRFYVKRVMPDGEVRRAVVFVRELVPRLSHLTALARDAGIGLTVDAVEADRLDLSLDIIEAVLSDQVTQWLGNVCHY